MAVFALAGILLVGDSLPALGQANSLAGQPVYVPPTAPNLPSQYAPFSATYQDSTATVAGVPLATPPGYMAPTQSTVWQPPDPTAAPPMEPLPEPVPDTATYYEERPGLISRLLNEPFFGTTGPQIGFSGSSGFNGPGEEPWVWQVLPTGLIYRSYLAGVRESRMQFFTGRQSNTGTDMGPVWEATLGGRVAIFRYGTTDPIFPEGWEVDVEGASFSRLDPIVGPQDLVANDYRFGLPITYGRGHWQFKLAVWHLSSHIGDEYLLRHPDYQRINYVRNAIVFGTSWTPTLNLRLYGEVGWAFHTNGGAKPFEMQWGIEYRPGYATGFKGAPFWAVNTQLLEDRNFSGFFCTQAGWAWRGVAGQIFRLGAQYVTGNATQFEFEGRFESQVGFGVWYDF